MKHVGRIAFFLLCAAGVVSGGFLLLCIGGYVSPEMWGVETEAAPVSAPAAEPVPARSFRAVLLSPEGLAEAGEVAFGYDGVVVPMKTCDGRLGYVSRLTAAADYGASSGDPARNEELRELNSRAGLHTVALVSCLRDDRAARLGEGGLHRANGSLWLDEEGVGWLNPSDPDAQIYLIGICRELALLGFDEILLADCNFPLRGNLAALNLSPEERAEGLETFCRRLQGALADLPVMVSVVGAFEAEQTSGFSGQTTALLASFPGRVWVNHGEEGAFSGFHPVILPEWE